MKSSPATIATILSQLAETHRRIAACTDGLPEARLRSAPNQKAWSALDVLAHLRACADLWTHSIYAMLAEENPSLPDINERKWAKITGYVSASFAPSFDAFRLQREDLLRVLHGLSPQQWERPAEIMGRRHTVFTQARRMARHESEHCTQIEMLLR